MSRTDLELKVDIDDLALDKEWVSQPTQVLRWTEELARARKAADAAKNKLEVVHAELDREIRQVPDNFGLSKVTETVVAETIILQEEHQDALSELADAKYELNMVQAAVTALDHKRKALEGLVNLHAMQYHAEPRSPEGMEDTVDLMEKKMIRNRRRD